MNDPQEYTIAAEWIAAAMLMTFFVSVALFSYVLDKVLECIAYKQTGKSKKYLIIGVLLTVYTVLTTSALVILYKTLTNYSFIQ